MKKFCVAVENIAIALFVPFVIAGCILPAFWYGVLASVIVASAAALLEPQKETVTHNVPFTVNNRPSHKYTKVA